MFQKSEKFNALINMLLDECIPINLLKKHNDSAFYYDLNTGAKSHIHIKYAGENHWGEEIIMLYGRYKEEEMELTDDPAMDVRYLCFLFKSFAMCGRDYANSCWFDLMKKHGVKHDN